MKRQTLRKYYVEVYRPAYPEQGYKYRVHRGTTFNRDHLSPCMVVVLSVKSWSVSEAIACAMARPSDLVSVVFGK